jgi:hypothetical protein
MYARFAKRLEGTDVTAAGAALAAYLEGSDLAEVVRRRLRGRGNGSSRA